MAQYILKKSDPWPNLLFGEEAQVFLPIGWEGGAIVANGLKLLFVQPYVPNPFYGGGVQTIRDWDEKLGAKPKCVSLSASGCSRIVLLHLEGDVTLLDLKGVSEEEKAAVSLKGLKGKTLKCDDWDQVVGTYQDLDFDEIDFGKDLAAKGFKDIQFNENTGKDGQPLRTSVWKTKYDPLPRKDSKGIRLAASTLGRMSFTGKGK